MFNLAGRLGAVIALLLVGTACAGSSTPTDPTSKADSTTPAQPSRPPSPASPAPTGFPQISSPARIYVAATSPYYSYHGSPLASRYVLYDDGTFALQYSSANYPFFEYRGRYRTGSDAVVTFEWEGWSTAGPWGATGTLTDDSLTVRYNLIMQLSDFEDGVFVRTK